MTRVVPDLLRRSAHLVPDRPAVVLDGQVGLSFAELEGRSNAFARGLLRAGVGHGDRVALEYGGADWPRYAVAYFGVLKIGAVALLTGTRFTDADLGRIVTGYRVAAVLRAPAVAVPAVPCPVLAHESVEEGESTGELPVQATADDAAEVVFTSGTTARPRGVVATHANLVRAQATWPTAVRANQPCAHALPLGSVAAQAVLLSCVGGQHTLVVASQFTVAGFTSMVDQQQAVTVCLVPAMGHWLVRPGADEATPMPSVKGVSFSGAPLPTAVLPDLPRVFPRAEFFNFYTSTETYPARVATRVDPRRPESVGRPVGTSAVRVTGPTGAELPAGEVGDVWLRAGGAPPRQVLDADDAGRADVRDGWTRTGDLGYLDAEGYLFLTGRTSDIVNIGGINVSAGRVEQVLRRHEAVAEAAVCGTAHPVLGEVLAAFVVLRDDATVRDLRAHAATHLSRHELPAIIRLVEDLPRNPAGKVVKGELPRLLETAGPAAFEAPSSPLERRVAQAWAHVLDLGAVSREDNFFEIGGDSLAANRIAAQLREELGVALDAIAVFESPTVAELAEHLALAGAATHDRIRESV
jgi:acyl-CoA synthetase (AMP-forming)/AMP-acid ligase II